jgi:hypothetical protein
MNNNIVYREFMTFANYLDNDNILYGPSSVTYYYLETKWNTVTFFERRNKNREDGIKEKIEYIIDILAKNPELVYNYINSYLITSYLTAYLNGNNELLGNILNGLLNPTIYNPKFTDSYECRAFIIYLNNLDSGAFFNDIIDLVKILRITNYCETRISEAENNNNGNNKLKKLKELKKYVTTSAFINAYFQKKNDGNTEENLKKFTNELLKKESPYSPVGRVESRQGKPEERQSGRIFDGLEIQFVSQGHNSKHNIYSNVRQKSVKDNHLWIPNKTKFEYILQNQELATEIINSSDNKSIVPLKNFIEKVLNNDITEIYNLLYNLCHSFTYFERAFTLYTFLLHYNTPLEGKNNYEFKTIKNEDGTFLTPFYQLYHLIRKHILKEITKKFKKTKTTKGKTTKGKVKGKGKSKKTLLKNVAHVNNKLDNSKPNNSKPNNSKPNNSKPNNKVPFNITSRTNFPELPKKNNK